jgi:hypothetical protein
MIGFCTAVGLTVLLLVAVVVTGVRGRITVHLPCVAATLASLATAIWFAKQLGTQFDLASAGVVTPIHMTFAYVATAAYVLPIVTGIRTLRSRKHRRLHFLAAMLVLALTAAATVTGALMLWWADALPQ